MSFVLPSVHIILLFTLVFCSPPYKICSQRYQFLFLKTTFKRDPNINGDHAGVAGGSVRLQKSLSLQTAMQVTNDAKEHSHQSIIGNLQVVHF